MSLIEVENVFADYQLFLDDIDLFQKAHDARVYHDIEWKRICIRIDFSMNLNYMIKKNDHMFFRLSNKSNDISFDVALKEDVFIDGFGVLSFELLTKNG